MYQIGIDIGGTAIKAGLVEDGKIISKKSIPTRVNDGADAIIDDIAKLVAELQSEVSAIVTGVGVGCPGAITSSSGIVDFSGNLKWSFVPLAEKLNKKIGLPVRVSNDANVAALGEAKYGAGKKYNSSVMITLGTGVGGGIIIDGKLFEGNQSKGAEIGHSVIKAGGEKCPGCQRRGCFEAYSSATALIRDTKRAMQKHPSSLLWQVCPDIEKVNGKTVFEARLLGDEAAIGVFEEYIRMLGESLVNVINTFRPEAIILGGGICGEGDVLLSPLKKFITENAFGEGPHVGLHIASLKNDAGIIGAAALVEWVNK